MKSGTEVCIKAVLKVEICLNSLNIIVRSLWFSEIKKNLLVTLTRIPFFTAGRFHVS